MIPQLHLYYDCFERSITSYWLGSSDYLFDLLEKHLPFLSVLDLTFPSSVYTDGSTYISLVWPVASVTHTVSPGSPLTSLPRYSPFSMLVCLSLFCESLISLNLTVSLKHNLSSSLLKPPKKP